MVEIHLAVLLLRPDRIPVPLQHDIYLPILSNARRGMSHFTQQIDRKSCTIYCFVACIVEFPWQDVGHAGDVCVWRWLDASGSQLLGHAILGSSVHHNVGLRVVSPQPANPNEFLRHNELQRTVPALGSACLQFSAGQLD